VTKEKAETFQVQSEKGRKCRVRINENCYNKIICTSGERNIYEVTRRLIRIEPEKVPYFSKIYIYFMMQIL